MRRFTFARGNSRKFAVLPLYVAGSIVSLLVPRRADHWAFGCGSGVGEGALALYLEARRSNPDLVLTWLARNGRDAADAAALGIRSVPVMSWRGFWQTLRAEVLVVTHGFGDVNRFGTHGGLIVQLWHGIPLKLIHLDSPATLRVPILPDSKAIRVVLRSLYRRAARSIALMPAASDVAAARLRTAFALPADRVVVTGDPRDDVLAQGSADERRSVARTRLAELVEFDLTDLTRLTDATDATDATNVTDAQVVLFAPTWRDGGVDPGIPSAAQWRAIATWFEASGAVLVIRPHPLSVGDYSSGPRASRRIVLLDSAIQPDITPLLPAIDVLVTDYSSIAYDFALTGGDILFLASDVAAYTASRGLYEPYEHFSGGREVTSWDELLVLLDRRERDGAFRGLLREHTEALARRNHLFRDGRNTVRVYTEITSRLKGTA